MEKKICGARKADFVGRDGQPVEGYQVSFSFPIPPENGKGTEAESHYISKAKLDSWGIDILGSVGRTASIFLSRTASGKTTVVGLSIK